MIEVTDRAREELDKLMQDHDGAVLRVYMEGFG